MIKSFITIMSRIATITLLVAHLAHAGEAGSGEDTFAFRFYRQISDLEIGLPDQELLADTNDPSYVRLTTQGISLRAGAGNLEWVQISPTARGLLWHNTDPDFLWIELDESTAGLALKFENRSEPNPTTQSPFNFIAYSQEGNLIEFNSAQVNATSGTVWILSPQVGIGKLLIDSSNSSILNEVVITGISRSNVTMPFSPNTADAFSLANDNTWNYKTTSGVTSNITIQPDKSVSITPKLTSEPYSQSFSELDLQQVLGLSKFSFSYRNRELVFTPKKPLTSIKLPLKTGDKLSSTSTGTVKENGSLVFPLVTAKLVVKAVAKEVVTMPPPDNSKVVANLISSKLSLKGRGIANTFVSYNWFVPYLGNVALSPSLSSAKRKYLQAFILNANNTTLDLLTDGDQDQVPDWRELVIKGTNWQDTDTDDDGVEDNIDNCPLIKNLSQSDTDQDSVGDDCEAVQSAIAQKGTLIDNPILNKDSLSVTLINCDGLAKAIADLPDSDTVVGNIQVKLNGTVIGALNGTTLSPNKKGIYSGVVQNPTSHSQVSIALAINTDSIVLKGKNVEAGGLTNPIKVRAEIGGWSCESESTWSQSLIRNGKKFVAPKLRN